MDSPGKSPLQRYGIHFFILYIFMSAPCLAFKSHEFKKCNDAHFCKRNRNRQPDPLPYTLSSGRLSGGTYSGLLSNPKFPDALFKATLTAYDVGIIRLEIDEEPKKGRFEVADVIEPSLELRRIQLLHTEKFKSLDLNATLLEAGSAVIEIRYNPFMILVFREGILQMAINSRGLFQFEHRRSKKEEGDEAGLWEETFKSHQDSKPKGPEAISFDLSFFNVRNVYGIPEHATSLSLRPTRGSSVQSEPYRLYNLDVFEYEHESPFGLYGSIPFMMGHGESQSAGFFWLNAAEMWVDVWETSEHEGVPQVDTQWTAEAGVFDVFFFVGPTPKDVVQQYTSVTGVTAMPPLFSTAYHQCRWNYKDEADVAHVDSSFEEYDIPYDVLWLDIEHTDGKRYMTWDSTHFPHPQKMQDAIRAKGRHMVAIVDPHVKRDSEYPLHKESTQKKYYVKDKDGNDFDGWCWPGSSSYLDVMSPAIRDWWATKFSYDSYKGSTPILHIWNDMNEPSVFNGPEVTMPKDNLHFGGAEHREVHNAYGYAYHAATAAGLLRRDGGRQRPFVLSRAAFAGTQKVGPIWTGDNTANWDHLRVSVPMLLTLGLSGIANAGADVGGFFGDPDAELMVRWYQLGAFYPFFRGHAHLDTKRREPWIFGEPYTSHIREAIRLRYSLLPYIYTLFREASVTGLPLARPFFLEFPQEASGFSHDGSFLLGPALLVQPVTSPGATSAEVYFPGKELWFHLKTGQAFGTGGVRRVVVPVTLDTVLAFQRGGTIVVKKDRPRRSTSQMTLDPYTIVVALDSEGKAEGELYIDDGNSYEFQNGAFIHRKFSFSNGKLTSTDAAPPGASGKGFSTPCKVERIVILGLDQSQLAVGRRAVLEGPNVSIEEESGSPIIRPGIPLSALVLRSPNVRISDDWIIRVYDI